MSDYLYIDFSSGFILILGMRYWFCKSSSFAPFFFSFHFVCRDSKDYGGFKDSVQIERKRVGADESTIGARDTVDAALKPVRRDLYAALNTRVCTYVYISNVV